jgi:hypothetical protein
VSEALEAELELVADCIRKNPKSYNAWHHRKWLLQGAKGAAQGGAFLEDFTTLLDRY